MTTAQRLAWIRQASYRDMAAELRLHAGTGPSNPWFSSGVEVAKAFSLTYSRKRKATPRIKRLEIQQELAADADQG